jgi:UDP-N-acetylglucosamine diphosphorylase/glucosamine-1-phosphate N-acetyltransferase
MRNLILFDDESRDHLLPLTYVRPASLLRCGILTIREKWEGYLHGKASFITSEYLTKKYPITIDDDNLVINGTVLPNTQLVKLISDLKPNEALVAEGDLVAANIPGSEFDAIISGTFAQEIAGYRLTETPVLQIRRNWDLLRYCQDELQCDFDLLTEQRAGEDVGSSNTLIGNPSDFFREPGSIISASVINTQEGPVYIGKNVRIMEGCMIRGPVAICDDAVLKMGTKIYGPTVIGPHSRVGGEINRSVFLGYANKAHDGYLGDSVIGEWCNLGAGTNVSNLKNTYQEIRMWNYALNEYEDTGRLFLGLIMGDHSKCGISTMFNTGTVVGVSANIFGGGYQDRFIPSFVWGSRGNWQSYRIEKAIETAGHVMQRRGEPFDEEDSAIFKSVSEHTESYRPVE